jgi:hypothetical protein
MFLVVLLAAGGLQRATAPPPPLPGGGSSSSSLAALGVLADLGPPHPPSPGHFATFRLHTVDASSGAVRLLPTTGGAACPVLDGVNCTLPDPYSDAAAGVVQPAHARHLTYECGELLLAAGPAGVLGCRLLGCRRAAAVDAMSRAQELLEPLALAADGS